jgi:molybdate transport system ATP-binding protein
MMAREIIRAEGIDIFLNGKPLLTRLSFVINEGEQWVITGASGTGKTTLLKVIAGQQFYRGKLLIHGSETNSGDIVLVEQQHHFKNLSNVSNFYYQQRFNSSDSEDAITVMEDLINHTGGAHGTVEDMKAIADFFHLSQLLDERLIQLSNGENKRLQIAKALLDKPKILLLDNPFIGLDTNARELLQQLLTDIVAKGIHIIMVTSTTHIPSFITHVLTLDHEGGHSVAAAGTISKGAVAAHQPRQQLDMQLFSALMNKSDHADFSVAVKMRNVNIAYHNKAILQGVNWTVEKGDCWSLSGPNGAGKSTLLSLITADNPQAYANEIYLFDRKRGTGETIWEIKKKIGYVSPELHLHFDHTNNSFEVIASGLFDTIGLFRQLGDEQIELVGQWMKLLNIIHLRNKYMSQLSGSEQRMVLLARALVKNPPMLVMDEPCQGLDEQQVETFKQLINDICIKGNKTLIYVSHYTEEIPECVNKFLKLENGRVVSQTSQRDLPRRH